ncbi:ubiquitin-like 1-activating enzyme E1 A [Cladophialophora psammophila CBS 110553]|uniref:Ubiquitin-like 1-activating enzyme E1A n=1 Tax=Cladophialophora psammophila CBS 110553 TaxID=1182543 RepID=W9WW86_9EURO|nr:ubiquitin-like 1-activating enzyme E1 A [Cladophialophora psammophila CBS 110553]EXJ72213.1 ubiquitin-like 1-activating enzyme E1 A [Cladophialophora psammophila CBS 110553]
MDETPLSGGSHPPNGTHLADRVAVDLNGAMAGPINEGIGGAINGSTFVTSVPVMSDLNGYPQLPDATFGSMALPINGMQPEMFVMQPQQPISADEIALYDRQIRLWGMQVQEKLRHANVLLIGMKGLGCEIAKNLVLAGVGVLTILDHEVVTEEDLGTQFFVSEAQIGQNRAQATLAELQKLNPRVEVYTDPNAAVTKDPEYFQNFDITIATGLIMDVLGTINMACRMYGRKFYAADTHGMYGYIFDDLIIHDFVIERQQRNKPTKVGDMETSTKCVTAVESKKENEKIMEMITYQETYSPIPLANLSPLPARVRNTRRSRTKVTPLLSCLRALFDFQGQMGGRLPGHNRADLELFTRLANQKHLELSLPLETLRSDFLRAFLQNLGSEISPVVAFLGGYLAQDVINVLGQKEQPLQNWLLFDGEDFTATQFSIHPINEDAMKMMNTNGAVMMPEVASMERTVPVA